MTESEYQLMLDAKWQRYHRNLRLMFWWIAGFMLACAGVLIWGLVEVLR